MSNSEKGLLHHQSHGSLLQKCKLENVFLHCLTAVTLVDLGVFYSLKSHVTFSNDQEFVKHPMIPRLFLP